MRNCESCGHQSLTGECPVFQTKMSGETNCPHHQKQIEFCGICGNPAGKTATIEVDEGKTHFICPSCVERPLCHTCAIGAQCALMDYEKCSLPLHIIKKVSPRPGVVMQMQVINPERVKATCGNGCKCYLEGEQVFCIRHLPNGGCSAYKTKWID